MKFAIGFAVPYRTRIARIAGYYRRDGRVISIYDTVTLTLVVAIIALLFLTGIQPLSFTGLVAGMLSSRSSSTGSAPLAASSHPKPARRHENHVVRD